MTDLANATQTSTVTNRFRIPDSTLQAERSVSLRNRLPALILLAALINCVFQVIWFWRYVGHNIDADAISYIGIARHIADGHFFASLHGYWSPLISWLMAATFTLSDDRLPTARVLMLALFALSLLLTYVLTQKLWGSRTLSALAVLWFSLARGIALFSLFVGADLLLTVVVLAYFIVLLKCLEHPQSQVGWFGLGAIHALAFLAKAIAMPLLAFTTILAVTISNQGNARRRIRDFAVALLLPIVVWAGWGLALKQKYGVFTAGYQLRFNLIDPGMKRARDPSDRLTILRATDQSYDDYLVSEGMAPGSRLWRVRILKKSLVGRIFDNERKNVQQACKEILVLLTPGGVLAVIACLWRLAKTRAASKTRFQFAVIALLASLALIAAYGMLVFDGRYVIPITPVLIALGLGFFASIPGGNIDDRTRWKSYRLAFAVLIALGLAGVQLYWASPFRRVRQDYQVSVYKAAEVLKNAEVRSIITVGEGPYAKHGVGWEAGMYSAYFSGSRIAGGLFASLEGTNPDAVVGDVTDISADAVVVWDAPADPTYSEVIREIRKIRPDWPSVTILDPHRGEVGTIFLAPDHAPLQR